MSEIQKLAKQAFNALVTKKRSGGDEFLSFKSGSPEWMKELARESHGDMLPDDHRYWFLNEALDLISSYDDLDDARNALEADIYTHDLTTWLNSRVDRTEYVDAAIGEYGEGYSFAEHLGQAQLIEKHEVFNLAANFLTELAEQEESA